MLLTNGVKYVSKRMQESMREVVLDMTKSYNLGEGVVTGVVGYPRRGFDDEHCDVRIVMVLDKDKTELGDGSPFVGIKVDVGYIIGVRGHSVSFGPNSSVITNPENPTEIDLQYYLESEGKPLHRMLF